LSKSSLKIEKLRSQYRLYGHGQTTTSLTEDRPPARSHDT